MTEQPLTRGELLPWQNSRRGPRPTPREELYKEAGPLNDMQWLALNAYTELLRLKNYSANTINVYRNWFTGYKRPVRP